jgi:hypothetical protein
MSKNQRIPKLSALRASSRTARAKIVEKCQRGMVHPRDIEDVWAWGQFLEIRGHTVQQPLGNQFGIYGTSAAVQMIVMQNARLGGSQTSTIEREALSGCGVLPLVLADPGDQYAPLHEHFIEKQDLLVTFKLASLLDAANCLEAVQLPNGYSVDKAALVRRLLELRRSGQGWPDYLSDKEWQGPNTHATAVAALALSKRTVQPEAQVACREALEWFYNTEPLEKQSIATLAMIVMALAGDGVDAGVRKRSPELTKLQAACEGLVCDWVGDSAPNEVQRSLEGTEYWLPPGSISPQVAGGNQFTYLFYLPHILVGLAILSSPRLRRGYAARRFTLLVIDRVTTEINQQGCFIAAGRSMVSTVEHLWLYRLLYEFENKGLYPHELVATIDRIRSFARRRWPVTSLGVLVVAGLGVAAALTKGSTQVALGAISATVATFAASIVAAFLLRAWWGE